MHVTPRHERSAPKHAAESSRGAVAGVDRRLFLGLVGAGAVAVGGGVFAAVSSAAAPRGPVASPTLASTPRATASATAPATPTPTPTPTETPTPTPTPEPTPSLPPLEKVALPGGALTELPGQGNLLAWTVDDGTNAAVIRHDTEVAAATGPRLTLFHNGSPAGWTQNADLLRPLVQSGQIQLGNHTFDHVDLTSQSDAGVIDQLQRNHDFILNTYGVDARPYFRPPYGYHDARVDRLAASIGYTCPVLWYGSLSDSGLITEQQVIDFATQWFLPQHIVIGHLNYLPVTNVFPQLSALVAERGLRTVTLDDVFLR